ncbi:hypothetical protein Dsin_030110 [Dipteronia sinensis]|uniref:CCHC-type domain-containing protein n=1 Tax=Dipteronia sinensis TaxID=43782 RepID=A0AAE0DQX0_9ROSI|nr:hypothetical protein Dsin_030110 [Dipteronia sinensis]
MIGDVLEIDDELSGDCVRKYICVRVVINVDEPLQRILWVDVMRDGNETIMLLRYERLLDHSYQCGRLGHVVRECSLAIEGDGSKDYNLVFGPWLKVPSPVKTWQYISQREGQRTGGVRSDMNGQPNDQPVAKNSMMPLRLDSDDKGKTVVVNTIMGAKGKVARERCITQSDSGMKPPCENSWIQN